MVIVLVDTITNRIQYTFDFICKSRGVDFTLVTNADEYRNAPTPKINYSSLLEDEFSIIPCGILLEEGVRHIGVEKNQFNAIECLSFDGKSDVIASIFYVLTRYEEYTCTSKDAHGRFPANESVLVKYNWIEQCVCDRWAVEILKFIGAQVSKTDVKLIPTFDIDNTYAYKLKRGKIKFLSIFKDLLSLNFARLKERKSVLRGAKDPYDTFDLIREIGIKNKETKLFWLIGKRAKKDRNISVDNLEHQSIIVSMDRDFEVNLHPSYDSNGNAQSIGKEKVKLESILNREIIRSRQHFLRFELPRTYKALISTGFSHEYSMGFAERVGFRSGTARSMHWFDLSANEVTKLQIHPFAYMDGTLNEYMLLSIEESKLKIQQLYDEVCQYGGDFIFIWHNETIGDYQKWKGWSEVLHFTLNLRNE